MIAQDMIIEIFMYYPCKDLYDLIDNKDLILTMLEGKIQTALDKYFLYTIGKTCTQLQGIVEQALVEGYTDIFFNCIGDIYNLEMLSYLAAEYGRTDVLNYLIKNYSESIGSNSNIASSATKGGHITIVKQMLELGVDKTYYIYCEAAKYGHLDIVRLFLDDCNYKSIACNAAEYGHLHIIKLLILRDYSDYIHIAYNAIYGGQRHIIDYMMYYNIDLNNIIDAVHSEEDMLYIIEKGANDWDEIARHSIIYGFDNTAIVAVRNSISDHDELIEISHLTNNHIVLDIIDRGH